MNQHLFNIILKSSCYNYLVGEILLSNGFSVDYQKGDCVGIVSGRDEAQGH